MDCGVAAYDNTFGLPPFFPTRLRFEDYIYRIWVQQDGVVSAHVDAAQHHTRSNYMRNPPAAEIFNKEVSNLIKRKVKDSVSRIHELGVSFDYDGTVTGEDAEEVSARSSGFTSAHCRPWPGHRTHNGLKRCASSPPASRGVLRVRAGFLSAEPRSESWTT